MRILGLDLGQKRIGVAISDPLGITAQGLEVISCVDRQLAVDRILKICRQYGVEKIVVGLPLRLDGTRGSAAEAAEQFKYLLAKTTGLPAVSVDERLTSKAAEQALLEGDVRRKNRKAVRDMLAAVLILDTYLRMSKTSRGVNAD
ncbi:MAG TPA: Holliday junction resolvase RuvX [Firmicutes bacterium]|nr:Holliday junction resolvase RuvX [Bacillota bacterium]